ncbi:hypothetical protein V1517DRAFT_329747 [Lipomyces orientalis]|uniref:Uncharacterized protein n=1 Tax=Lipomyces orientalis TaxID=1233043 RepID=A0ACC3TH48_9ASCO
MRTMTSLPSLEVYQAAQRTRLEQDEILKNVQGLNIQMTIQPMSSSTIKSSDARGGNPLGLKAQGHQWFLILADWTIAEDEARVREAVRKIVGATEDTAKKNGMYIPFKYSNYFAPDQDPLASYGTENIQKLQEIALQYDPDGVFQKLQNGGWLLSRTGV